MAVAAALSAGLVAAEAPSRDEVAQKPLLTRGAGFGIAQYNGIWDVNLATGALGRVRPLVLTYHYPYSTGSFFNGGEGALSAHGDTVSYRTWPGVLEFDLLSWRLVRRLPSATRPGDVGWVLVGPSLGTEDSGRVGILPGTYGFPWCLRRLFTWSGPGYGYDWLECEPEAPSFFPTGTPYFSRLVYQPPAVSGGETLAVGELPDVGWRVNLPFTRLLSPDARRGGFWRPTPRGYQFIRLPAGGGIEVDPVRDFHGELLELENTEVRTLVYHEPSDSLVGSVYDIPWTGSSQGYWIFAADPETGEMRTLTNIEYDVDGNPYTWASLGRPPQEHVQTVPIVGGGRGARGTDWSTELWLFNPSPLPQTASLRRVARPDQARTLEIPGHGSLRIEDALTWLGAGADGDGVRHEAVVVTSVHRWAEQLVVQGRISTADPDTGGRFGHAVPAVPGRLGYSNHLAWVYGVDHELDRLFLPTMASAYLDLDLGEPGRFRANVGVVNDLDLPVTLKLVWTHALYKEPFGARPAESVQEITVPPHGVVLRSLEELFPAEIVAGFPPRIAVAGDRPAIVWLSLVDNLTGDATFVPFTTYQLFNDAPWDRLVIPAVASTQGVNGSRWRTDVLGVMALDYPLGGMLATFRPEDPTGDCGGAAVVAPIEGWVGGELGMPIATWLSTLEELYGQRPSEGWASHGYNTVYRDVVRRFAPCAGEVSTKGALEVATASWTAGWSRTSTTRPDGGTYGGMLPFYPPGGWPVQHFAGLEVNAEQRINVGLYNGIAEHPVTHRLLLYAADGTLAASREIVLQPHEHRQEPLARLLAVPVATLPDGLYGLTVIPLDDPEQGLEGRSWAYVSLVDNRTNDPVNLW